MSEMKTKMNCIDLIFGVPLPPILEERIADESRTYRLRATHGLPADPAISGNRGAASRGPQSHQVSLSGPVLLHGVCLCLRLPMVAVVASAQDGV